MTRVVADTNIFISGLVFGGLPEKFLLSAKEERFKLFVSPPILQEITITLARKFEWSSGEITTVLDSISKLSNLIIPEPLTDVVIKADPSDDRILECALAARADIIVSGDKHLLKLDYFYGIEIMTIRNFLDLVR